MKKLLYLFFFTVLTLSGFAQRKAFEVKTTGRQAGNQGCEAFAYRVRPLAENSFQLAKPNKTYQTLRSGLKQLFASLRQLYEFLYGKTFKAGF